MPQINRDKETLYPPGRLSLWFLGTSAALVGAIVWMLAGDFVRPWKSVQRDFFDRHARLLEVKRELVEREARQPDPKDEEAVKDLAKLRDLRAQIALAERALEEKGRREELARLRAEATEQGARLVETETRIKAVKGAYAERRYAYEMALKNDPKKVSELADKVDRLGSDLSKAEALRTEVLVARERARTALDALTAELRGLEAQRDALLAKTEKAGALVEAERAKIDRNQWRNLPFADIINPSIRIEKVVLADIHDDMVFATSPKVDMCMTCHAGIDKAMLSEEGDATTIGVRGLLTGFLRMRLGEKVWSRVEKSETLLSRIAPGRLRPWLTSGHAVLYAEPSPAGKLTPTEDRSQPLFDKQELEDAFVAAAARDGLTKEQQKEAGLRTFREVTGGKDLLAAFRLEPVQWAHPHLELMVGSKSPHPMERAGCTVCHAGVGRRLDFARASHAPGSAEQKAAWVREHDWEVQHYVDFPMLPTAYVQGQCVKCHKAGVCYPAKPELLVQPPVKESPTDKVAKRPTAPNPRKTTAEVDGAWHPDVLDVGLDRVREYGCQGCHVIKGLGTSPGFAPEGWGKEYVGSSKGDPSQPPRGSLTAEGQPKVAPPLTHIADKTTESWAFRWLSSPNLYRPDTRMPSFYRQAERDDHFRLVLGADGKPKNEPIVVGATSRDEAQMEVEQIAIVKALFAKSKRRSQAYPDVPAGDVKKGAEAFYARGNCFACHVGPGRYGADGQLVPDSLERFLEATNDLPAGPRLTAMGSKVEAKWLYAWLADPRHYNAVTRMPYNRFKDQLAADGKTVVRSADQIRADLVAYLLSFKDPAFDAIEVKDPLTKPGAWTSDHVDILTDLWMEWMGKRDPEDRTKGISVAAARQYAQDGAKLPLERKLVEVGEKLLGFRGCFGCHDVAGYEDAQPVGKELTYEGSQNLHQFDFGILPKHEVEHNRWSWIEAKLAQPRIFDKGRLKLWTERLRMPKFNLRPADRTAVTSVVLGLVKEPILPGALPKPTHRTQALLAGRAVVARYGCNNCHTIEGKEGYAVGDQRARGLELALLPPNLYGQGNRTRAEWLFKFLKEPHDLRPEVIQRMPQFRLSDEEASALVDYFLALAGRKDRNWSDLEDAPLDDTPYPQPVTVDVKGVPVTVTSPRDEAKALFEAFNCAKCHLAKGTFGADPEEGGVAPPFTLSGPRLRRDWVEELLINPQNQINGTKMVQFWPGKARRGKPLPPPDSITLTYPQLPCGARFKEGATNDDVAVAQMKAVTRYLLYHYEPPKPPTAPPSPPEGGGTEGK